MMKSSFVLLLCLVLKGLVFAQADTLRIYHLTELNSAHPDSVFYISLSREKLIEVPEIIAKFTQVRVLDLGKNKLSELPDFIGEMKYIEVLDLSKNELSIFPTEICRLTNLKTLIINRNTFDQIPECFGYCTKVESIDLWEVPIAHFPQSMDQLKALKVIEIQGVKYGPSFQEALRKRLPWVDIRFDAPCDCME
jgi:Leucine-rich repeat (LRR) protein